MTGKIIQPPTTGNAIVGCMYALLFDVVLIGVLYGIYRLIQFLF